MRQVVVLQGVLQGLRNVLLPHHFVEACGTVFSGGNYELRHASNGFFAGKGTKKSGLGNAIFQG
jgi:hypothetical protein